MAIIRCHECKKEISDQAASCVGCGAPIAKPPVVNPPVFDPPVVVRPGWLVCPRCRSDNVSIFVNTVMKSRSRSCLWNAFMISITAGFWLIWMFVRKKKEKMVTAKTAVCNYCGNSWAVN